MNAGVVFAHVCVRQKNHVVHKKLSLAVLPVQIGASGSVGQLRGGHPCVLSCAGPVAAQGCRSSS